MNLFKNLFCRNALKNISKFNRKISSLQQPCYYYTRNATITTSCSRICRSIHPPEAKFRGFLQFNWYYNRCIHTAQETNLRDSSKDESEEEEEEEEDPAMNEFLSRFVWIMRGKLNEAYPESDKETIDGMLLIIVGKVVSEMEKGGLEQMVGAAAATPSQDFSGDLWRTVWEVSNVVLEDMQRAQKKERMKTFLQSDEVKEMCRFAGEIGIRGDMLRELRFKWAREKMEEGEFYESLESLRQEEAEEGMRLETNTTGQEHIFIGGDVDERVDGERPNVVTLPKRHGKLKYKIYGLELSDPKWAEFADKIHETGEIIWPQEAKPITGKCKIVTEKILSLQMDDDPSELLAEWVELHQPSRTDWIVLLDRLKEQNTGLYLKIAELVLDEESFGKNIRDYSKLVDIHASENRLEDAERILKKMNESGILPDILVLTTMVHMYSKEGELNRAKEAFENLRNHGLRPDMRVYNSMIMGYVNSGQPKLGESLMREMETRDIKPTKEIFMALLRSFSQLGDVSGAQRIATSMQFAGFQPSLESSTLLVEAFGQARDPDQARNHFDSIMGLGHKPDDKCTASMIAAYEKKNSLDKALNLLSELEKGGFEPGVATYTVLVDWLGKLQLIDETEQLLNKIAELGEVPPFKVHISLCDMYSRARMEKKALQALAVVESKREQLGQEGFERIITGLKDGGFVQDADRMYQLMEAQGLSASETLKVTLMASKGFQTFKKQTMRYS